MSTDQTSLARNGASTSKNEISLDATGVPDLDTVLGGGLPRGAMVIVVGPPGSGKTTLASQVAFEFARAGRRSLILTALSEPTTKLTEHLRTLSFFDECLVGDQVQILSLQQLLADGLESVADQIVAIARQMRADLVMLDGFRGVRGADPDPQAARQFLYEVGAKLGFLRITTLITSEADPDDPSFFSEATTADLIIGLHYDLVGVRHHRAIEIVKVRGGALMPGLHGFRLSQRGARVYPRLETRIPHHPDFDEPDTNLAIDELHDGSLYDGARAPFGLPELDRLLDGGIPVGTSTLVVGSLGTGKTLLALHFALKCVEDGYPTVFVGFRETLPQLLRKADAFDIGHSLRQAVGPGAGLTVLRWPPVELNPDIIAARLLEVIDRTHAKRLVLDGVAELEHAITRYDSSGRVGDYLAALVETLHERQVTSLFVAEHPKVVASQLDFAADPISVLAENVLLLQQVSYRSRLHRILSVIKMRFSEHDYVLREFKITAPSGIEVITPVDSGGDIYAGLSRQQHTQSPQRRRSERKSSRQADSSEQPSAEEGRP